MSQPVPALTQLFPSSLRAWQARWKATQEASAPRVLAEPAPAVTVTPDSASTAKPKRRRKRSARAETCLKD